MIDQWIDVIYINIYIIYMGMLIHSFCLPH